MHPLKLSVVKLSALASAVKDLDPSEVAREAITYFFLEVKYLSIKIYVGDMLVYFLSLQDKERVALLFHSSLC